MKSKILAVGLIVTLVAAATAVKFLWFPSIKEDYFGMNQRSLLQVPSGLVVIRPTHFSKSMRKGVMSGNVQVGRKQVWRMMGRNVTFSQLIAAAYGRNPDRVVLPPEAPGTNFDFLVTVSDKPQPRLQAAIRTKLGYIARPEMRDTEVLALKVLDASLPGLTVSDANSKPNVNFDQGKLQFTHMRVQMMTDGLEQALKQPVVDKTELTNFYDFSVSWDAKMQRQLQNDTTAAAAVKKILNGWGLGIVPDNDSVEILVVRRAG